MVSSSQIANRMSGAARHVHTTGTFALQLHSSRVSSVCTWHSTLQGHSPTDAFLQDFTSEIRAVVGSSLFATVVGAGISKYGEEGAVENNYFVIENSAATASPAPASSSSLSTSTTTTTTSYVTLRLRVKDSRISAAIFTAIAKHSFIVLSDCRVMMMTTQASSSSSSATTGGAVAPQPPKISPDTMNMDDELFAAIENATSTSTSGGGATPLFNHLREQKRQFQPQGGGGVVASVAAGLDVVDVPRLLEEHSAFIASIQSASVYSEPGSGVASPFATLLWCLFTMPVTHDELTTILAVHQNRYLRAAAMYYARYLCPLENLAAVFGPSMDDATVIACAGDMSETRSMKDLATKLLLEDEVDEAWLPTYSKWWMRMVIEPTIRLMASHKEAAEKAAMMRGRVRVAAASNAASTSSTGAGGDGHHNNKRPREENGGDGSAAAGGRGGGGKATLMGFRSALELALFVDQARMLATGDILQQMLQATKDQKDGAEDGDGDDGDEEAAWARKHGGSIVGGGTATKAAPTASASAAQPPSGSSHDDAASKDRPLKAAASAAATVDVRKLAASRAQKAILELLGPQGVSRALRKNDPAYLRI